MRDLLDASAPVDVVRMYSITSQSHPGNDSMSEIKWLFHRKKMKRKACRVVVLIYVSYLSSEV